MKALEIEARYLAIEWLSEGISRSIESAPDSLRIDVREDGVLVVETAIFNDFHPWIGFRFGSTPEPIEPVLVEASGGERPLLRLRDRKSDDPWWVCADEWDDEGRRHFSELQRSPGLYTIRAGSQTLQVDNRLSGLGRADIQAYVDDFRGELLWMLLNDGAGATAKGSGFGQGAALADALEQLHDASLAILAAPSVSVRDTQERQPVSRLRPGPPSFREYVRNPSAREITGRVSSESPDIPENRYLRRMIDVAIRLADAFQVAASAQADFQERLAAQESQRARDLLAIEARDIDPAVYDAQTNEISERLKAIRSYEGADAGEGRFQEFPIRIRGRYPYRENAFYYERQSSRGDIAKTDVNYRILILPSPVVELVLSSKFFIPDITVEGWASSDIKVTSSGKRYRELAFSSVSRLTPLGDPLETRARKRLRLERIGWRVDISRSERKELRREAKVAERLADRLMETRRGVQSSMSAVIRARSKLAKVDEGLEALGIGKSATWPLGMTFVSNPNYAASFAAHKKVREILVTGGLDLSKFEAIQSFGILHASSIYEKWCLLQLLAILIQDFGFSAEPAWKEKLVSTSISRERNVRFELLRADVGLKVELSVQLEMATGRRPDFVLEVMDIAGPGNPEEGSGVRSVDGIVIDAKFRTSWRKGELENVLDELTLAKNYGNAVRSRRVFVIQPSESTVWPPVSPLEWGRDCDYGGTQSHERGWVQAGVGARGSRSIAHLKRLLGMVLQASFPAPVREETDSSDARWVSRSFCLGCGRRHSPSEIQAKTTERGKPTWLLDCADCRLWTVRTHCYGCGETLFKNGTSWTYHTTVAEQVTNVICPECMAYFSNESDERQ